ncbi:GNAT family N-acetyltransferase [Flavobacteriaceae bacterium M23B6Z8]
MISIHTLSFADLDTNLLYGLLQLRSEVFVVEQDCVYQDMDGKDHKALHVIGLKNDEVVAYARIFKPGDYFDEAAIGRVVVKNTQREYGYGHQILKASIAAIKTNFKTHRIRLSAQTYLIHFYEQHGFITDGETYLEDGIPHINMVLKDQ